MAKSKVTFNADGTLLYDAPGGGSSGNWKLEGNVLCFDINNYSEYKTIVNGNVIEGTGRNKAGQECKPMLIRSDSAAPIPVFKANAKGLP